MVLLTQENSPLAKAYLAATPAACELEPEIQGDPLFRQCVDRVE